MVKIAKVFFVKWNITQITFAGGKESFLFYHSFSLYGFCECNACMHISAKNKKEKMVTVNVMVGYKENDWAILETGLEFSEFNPDK